MQESRGSSHSFLLLELARTGSGCCASPGTRGRSSRPPCGAWHGSGRPAPQSSGPACCGTSWSWRCSWETSSTPEIPRREPRRGDTFWRMNNLLRASPLAFAGAELLAEAIAISSLLALRDFKCDGISSLHFLCFSLIQSKADAAQTLLREPGPEECRRGDGPVWCTHTQQDVGFSWLRFARFTLAAWFFSLRLQPAEKIAKMQVPPVWAWQGAACDTCRYQRA